MANKDDDNLAKVLAKIDSAEEPFRALMRQLHDLVLATVPELKPRLWYGMPGYAKSADSPVLLFFRRDERMTLGLTEKVAYRPGADSRLMPAAWYFDALDPATAQQVARIVRAAVS